MMGATVEIDDDGDRLVTLVSIRRRESR